VDFLPTIPALTVVIMIFAPMLPNEGHVSLHSENFDTIYRAVEDLFYYLIFISRCTSSSCAKLTTLAMPIAGLRPLIESMTLWIDWVLVEPFGL
jgi:hypothetical protein